MVKWKLICLIAVAFLLVTDEVKGKDNSLMYSDAGSWNTFSISYAFNKKLALLFTEELRLKENYSRLNLFYTNVGVEYKVNKYFKTSLVYRWIDKYLENDNFSFRHRLMWEQSNSHIKSIRFHTVIVYKWRREI